jgi:hypothetical protein
MAATVIDFVYQRLSRMASRMVKEQDIRLDKGVTPIKFALLVSRELEGRDVKEFREAVEEARDLGASGEIDLSLANIILSYPDLFQTILDQGLAA